jgi:hypothetical protein
VNHPSFIYISHIPQSLRRYLTHLTPSATLCAYNTMPDTDHSTVHEIPDDSMITQRPISQIPFAASSNATPSTTLSSPIIHTAQRRDNSLGGGKLGKSTRSWGNLPNNVIQYVPCPLIARYTHKTRPADQTVRYSTT